MNTRLTRGLAAITLALAASGASAALVTLLYGTRIAWANSHALLGPWQRARLDTIAELDRNSNLVHIAGNMLYVLDTNVLVAAVRSPLGASAELFRRVLQRQVPVLSSVPLFLEYEEVLSRPEHLAAAGAQLRDVQNLLDVLAGVVDPVSIQFLWRPLLRDPKDDMVLELAVNGLGLGQPVTLITFNQRDFLPQANVFGISVIGPAQFFQGV